MQISNNQSWYVNPNTRNLTSNNKNTALKDKEALKYMFDENESKSAGTCGDKDGVRNGVSEYDYDKSFGTYHTSRQMAGFLLELYDSEKVVGIVDRESFSFRLADPLFPYAGNSAHNQQRM